MKFNILRWTLLVSFLTVAKPAMAQGGYPRAGAEATLSTLAHHVSGTATIVDSRTVRVEQFNYDGTAPNVYFYLGTNDSYNAFANGIPIGDRLIRAYDNETFMIQLPDGQSLDGYNAISVWCVSARANFGSGTFEPPVVPPHVDSIAHTNHSTSVTVSGQIGQIYQLEASTNLLNWTGLEMRTNTTGEVSFTDNSSDAERFYRVVQE